MKERLLKLADFYGLSIRKFESSCGLVRGNISNMTDESAIGTDKLAKIIDKYPDVNLNWVLNGKGEMVKTCPVTGKPLQNVSNNISDVRGSVGDIITTGDIGVKNAGKIVFKEKACMFGNAQEGKEDKTDLVPELLKEKDMRIEDWMKLHSIQMAEKDNYINRVVKSSYDRGMEKDAQINRLNNQIDKLHDQIAGLHSQINELHKQANKLIDMINK